MINSYPIVTIPSLIYNNAHFFEESLISIINQTYPRDRIEHIIIDDFSTDNSVEIIESLIKKYNYKCKFIKNKKNLGISKSNNKILKICKGKYFCGISDDIWDRNKLKILITALESADKDYALICSNFFCFKNINDVDINPYFSKDFFFPTEDLFSSFLNSKKVLIATPTTLIKTQIIKNLGYYDESLFHEDFDMWLRIIIKYKVMYIPKPLVKYRLHENNVSKIHWNKLVEDNYKSIEKNQKINILTPKQHETLFLKKLELSKNLTLIKLNKNDKGFIDYSKNIFSKLKNNKNINQNLIIKGLDDYLIFIFKRHSFMARKLNKTLKYKFSKRKGLFNIIFFIGNISKRLDYYILKMISIFNLTENN